VIRARADRLRPHGENRVQRFIWRLSGQEGHPSSGIGFQGAAQVTNCLRSAAEHELEAGTPRERVVARLEALRGGLSDSDEDAMLEVLDFVTGRCSQHVRL
jgi:hypothetical protein